MEISCSKTAVWVSLPFPPTVASECVFSLSVMKEGQLQQPSLGFPSGSKHYSVKEILLHQSSLHLLFIQAGDLLFVSRSCSNSVF